MFRQSGRQKMGGCQENFKQLLFFQLTSVELLKPVEKNDMPGIQLHQCDRCLPVKVINLLHIINMN